MCTAHLLLLLTECGGDVVALLCCAVMRGVAWRCNGWCGAVVQLVRQESKRVAVQDAEKLIVKTKKVTQRAMNPSDNMEVGDIHIGYKLNSLGSLMLRDSVSASFYCDFKLFAWWCVHPCTRSHMLRVVPHAYDSAGLHHTCSHHH